MASLDTKIPPPVVGILVAAAMWGASLLGPRLAVVPGPGYALAVVFISAAFIFELLSLITFRRARTTINPLKPQSTSALVTGGVYGVTRNPMYVGLGLLLLAWAIYLSALLPFAGPVVYVLYITRFQIQPEERILKRIFGNDYTNYCARVRRWL